MTNKLFNINDIKTPDIQIPALILGIEEPIFLEAMQDVENPITRAYNRGKLIAEVEFDKKVIQLSNQGSGPAQSLLYKMRINQEYYTLLASYGE